MKIFKSVLLLVLAVSTQAFALQGEYHWTICETSPAVVKKQLNATVKKSSRRAVYYLDTANRDLYRAGVILRLRGEAGEPLEVTVKLNVDPKKIPEEFQNDEGFKAERDFHGANRAVHCSLSAEELDPSDLAKYLKGKLDAQDLLTKTQHRYLAALGVSVPWKQLAVYGAIDNLKWKLKATPANVDMELMTAKSGATLFGLSVKSDPGTDKEFQALTGELVAKGIRLCPKQIGTTAWALGVDQGRRPPRLN